MSLGKWVCVALPVDLLHVARLLDGVLLLQGHMQGDRGVRRKAFRHLIFI